MVDIIGGGVAGRAVGPQGGGGLQLDGGNCLGGDYLA